MASPLLNVKPLQASNLVDDHVFDASLTAFSQRFMKVMNAVITDPERQIRAVQRVYARNNLRALEAQFQGRIPYPHMTYRVATIGINHESYNLTAMRHGGVQMDVQDGYHLYLHATPLRVALELTIRTKDAAHTDYLIRTLLHEERQFSYDIGEGKYLLGIKCAIQGEIQIQEPETGATGENSVETYSFDFNGELHTYHGWLIKVPTIKTVEVEYALRNNASGQIDAPTLQRMYDEGVISLVKLEGPEKGNFSAPQRAHQVEDR